MHEGKVGHEQHVWPLPTPSALSNYSLMVKKVIPLFHSTIPFQWNIPPIQYHHHGSQSLRQPGCCRLLQLGSLLSRVVRLEWWLHVQTIAIGENCSLLSTWPASSTLLLCKQGGQAMYIGTEQNFPTELVPTKLAEPCTYLGQPQ